MLKGVLDVLLPSVCSIFSRVLPTLFNYGRGKWVWLQCRWCCCPSSTSLLLGYHCFCCWDQGSFRDESSCNTEEINSSDPMAGRKPRNSRTTSTDLVSSSLSLPQCRSCHYNQRAPAAETVVTQQRGGRRRMTASTALKSNSFPPTIVECRKDHSWRCRTLMVVKRQEHLSTSDQGLQAW